MLNSLIANKASFSAFINRHCPYKGSNCGVLLNEETWHIVESMFQFFEPSYDSTIALSGV
jgi:hypothetical protein